MTKCAAAALHSVGYSTALLADARPEHRLYGMAYCALHYLNALCWEESGARTWLPIAVAGERICCLLLATKYSGIGYFYVG